jgi:hypothetical protein
MFRPVSVLLLSSLVLTSCGSVRDSRINPLNWFGSGRVETATTGAGEVNPLIPKRRESAFARKPVDTTYYGTEVAEVTHLVVDRRPGGAIIRASGVSRQQGSFDVQLVPVPEESDAKTLTYALSAIQNETGQVGTAPSRTVTAAVTLTDEELFGIRTIRVKSQNNVRSARR